ncbi:hypothetical protein C8A03DRAFT_12034 [Achaetomium macrosporum]|uniref:Protein ECM13 n=1 Tax=Achaetomium macrosporum TaxID=79813 RepID=A0AAN7CGJ1_9PEZI|nr:hypothetical protein C8A03DRAFT_12034 [Achaetomium macrosporum]
MSSPLPIPSRKQQAPRPSGSSPATIAAPPSPFRPRANKKMSIAQTYFLAHKARAKLSYEAARPDHNLRLLVGHANLLDSLMLELADAEREQESWFNQSVRGASQHTSEEKHIQWADTIVEEPEQDWHAEDAELDSDDSDSDSYSDLSDDEDMEMADAVSLRRIPSNTMLPHKVDYGYNEEDDYDMDDEEDYAQLALQRSRSHSTSPSSPPELDDDSDSTEDESMPPSPPTALIPAFEEPQKRSSTTTTATDPIDKTAPYEGGYYLPPQGGLISAISVY